MILPDINLLVYAFNADAPQHGAAARWWEKCFNENERVGITWTVLLGFIRLLSGRMVVQFPYAVDDLYRIIDRWFEYPHLVLLEPTWRTYQLVRALMVEQNLPGSITSDAFLAASALEHDAVLCSNDVDFARFPGVRLNNPLRE